MLAMKAMAAFLLLALMGMPVQAAPCPCTNFFTGDAKAFIAEGIARDTATGRFFVAGVAARRMVEIRDGRSAGFCLAARRIFAAWHHGGRKYFVGDGGGGASRRWS